MNFGNLIKTNNYRDGITTRFAPSPTGRLHIGGARNALLSWVMSRGAGGGDNARFILRIEDTDQKRMVEGSTAEIIAGLKWLGISPDETHVQSQRLSKYNRFVHDYDLMFYDGSRRRLGDEEIRPYFCGMGEEGAAIVANRDSDPDKFDELVGKYLEHVDGVTTVGVARNRDDAVRAFIAGHRTGRWCRPWVGNAFIHLSATALGRSQGQTNYTIRIATHYGGETTWVGQNGEKTINNSGAAYDAIIMKADGYPTYFLGAGFDDIEMGVGLVIRGTEWQPSTPVYVAVSRLVANWAAMANIPEIWHVPVILDPSGNGKLSKRRLGNDANSDKVFLLDIANAGYPPEAVRSWLLTSVLKLGNDTPYVSTDDIINRIARDGSTLTTQNQMINFSLLDRIAHTVMSNSDVDELAADVKKYATKDVVVALEHIEALDAGVAYDIIKFLGDRCRRYNEIGVYLDCIENPVAEYAAGRSEEVASIIKTNFKLVTDNNVDGLLNKVIAGTGLKRGVALAEIRAVLTASPVSLPIELAIAAMNETQLSRNIELCLTK